MSFAAPALIAAPPPRAAAALAPGGDLWQPRAVAGQFTPQLQRLFWVAALVVWLALGWPVLQALVTGAPIRRAPVPAAWLVPFALFGLAMLSAMALRLGARATWALILVQLGCVLAMTAALPWAGMSQFLVITAWQAATVARPARGVAFAVGQTLAVVAMLAQSLNPDICWVINKSFALQLLLVFTAHALRREAATARALEHSNGELRAAQAIIAASARDAERLRISRELHDAWGHELTALGLQLEIASHVAEPARALSHVAQARGLSRALLAKVRDVVAALREAERCELAEALQGFARSVPVPAIHVDVAPGLAVPAEQAHALIRCAQEAVTNAVRHADAANLWLSVRLEADGIRLLARDDGRAEPAGAAPGSGLRGMRERLEQLGGRLAIRAAAGRGFTVDAWLPAPAPRAA